jgi:hypothetical protein
VLDDGSIMYLFLLHKKLLMSAKKDLLKFEFI